jgi:hypothetical protein
MAYTHQMVVGHVGSALVVAKGIPEMHRMILAACGKA